MPFQPTGGEAAELEGTPAPAQAVGTGSNGRGSQAMPEADTFSERMTFAVLIDGDNAQPALIKEMLEEVGRHGVPTIRRVYGDWGKDHMGGWSKVIHEYALQPIQTSSFVAGKNSTDASLIIDAMDILYSGNVEAFCIVSSDSDYTHLVMRLREAGKFVMVIGNKQRTASPLIRSTNLFVDPRNLTSDGQDEATAEGLDKARQLLTRAYELTEGDDGWAELGALGDMLRQLDSSFDLREYGAEKLLDLIEANDDLFEIRRERDSGPSPVYIRKRD
jgi:uncharacterized protein (TIGR00288 family)